MKLIYMGTPDFAVPALQALYDAGHEIEYVVTQPDTVRDRGKKVKFPPVKERAVELGIPVLQPETLKYNEEFLDTIRAAEPDAIIVAAYGKLITRRILETPKYGCLNIHGSLLPRFRGAAPIQAAIIAGDQETGITIMQMARGLDTGDMLTKAATPIADKTGQELHDELSEIGAALICETLVKLEAGEIVPQKQNDSLATYAPMISKEDGHVDFSQSAAQIERKIRAFNPWPGSFASIEDRTFKFWKAEALVSGETPKNAEGQKAEPGTVLTADEQGLEIATGLGILRVTELQAPGKKRVSAADYFRGNSIEIGSVLR